MLLVKHHSARRLVDTKYRFNVTTVKEIGYGDCKSLKVTTVRCLRTKGIEEEKKYSARCSVNEQKLDNNVWRSKQKIFELAFCNPWEWFVTFTIDKSKFNRTDLKKYYKHFTQFIRDYCKKHSIKIKYLLTPELHSDGESWHLHGLMYGLPQELLHRFVIGDVMSDYIAKKVANGACVYNWREYQSKFGFCCIEPVTSHQRVSCYITKYINKDLYRSVTELNANLYYRSQGLQTAKVLKQGTFTGDYTPDWEGEFCKTKTLPYTEENLSYLLDNTVNYTPDEVYDYDF